MKFIIDKSGYPIEAWQDGRRVHMILSKSHFDEIRDVSDMTHLEDYEHYIEYLQNNGFINLTGMKWCRYCGCDIAEADILRWSGCCSLICWAKENGEEPEPREDHDDFEGWKVGQ